MHPVVDILKGGLIPRFPARSYLRCFYAYHVHSWRSTRKARVQRFSQVDCLLVPESFHHCATVQGCYNQKKLRGPCILCPLAATRLLLSTAQASDVAHTTSAEHKLSSHGGVDVILNGQQILEISSSQLSWRL